MPSRRIAIKLILVRGAGLPARRREAAMLDDVYNKRILSLAANIPLLERLPSPDATARAHSKLCGSTVTVDLTMEGDVVTGFGHEVKACALGQASSSIMAQHVVGSTAQELRELREQARAILKQNGEPPQGKWADLAVLVPVRDYKARHASTMLTFDAVVDAIDQIEARRREAAA
ncbi:NifU homolog involved in Fe-S cluster formation [Bosea sp. TND4EK4]|nr:NifU homolog involved in Fe-S cluster formation [Bosea sp. TND4EK4]